MKRIARRGDASVVFSDQLAEMKCHAAAESVVRWANRRSAPHFAAICRRLLLPGSGIDGFANLSTLARLARDGSPCLLCLNHRSNLDVPTLYTLLEDQADPDLFQQIIWIAGRKLEEDIGMTSMLVQCFNRVIVTPPSWFASRHSDDDLHKARLINIAAERATAQLRYEGGCLHSFRPPRASVLTTSRPSSLSSRATAIYECFSTWCCVTSTAARRP